MPPKRQSDARAPKTAPKKPRTSKEKKQVEVTAPLKFKSPAEFFAENKNIAGFDNPGKSLYTTIRELVENGLDAAETVPILPDINVEIDYVSQARFNELVGIHTRVKVDTGLYKGSEPKSKKAKDKREAPATSNGEAADPPRVGRSDGSGFFTVRVTDNGTGMGHEDVPNMMGRVLAGTKYNVRQARGKFGLGSKMALIWAKMSTGLPVEIRTSLGPEADVTECSLDIDIAQNIPNVIRHEHVPNIANWRGTQVKVTIEGNWTTYRSRILQYLRQMAVITPYARFSFRFAGDREDRCFGLTFSRRSETMPPSARIVKHHPSSVNQLVIKQLVSEVRAGTKLVDFMTREFSNINKALALRLVAELGNDFNPAMPVSDLNLNHIRQLDSIFREAHFDKPSGDCLSPAGEYNLRLGIMKEMKPDLLATHAEPVEVFEGHPFIVETGVSLGGAKVKPGINIFRFANRIPLLFEAGNDVVTRTALNSINWTSYKISSAQDRVGVFSSIVSTKIPFKGTGKEYIGDDAEQIKKAVKKSISQCCSQLRIKLVRKAALKDRAERKRNIVKYVPDVSNALVTFFEALDTNTVPEAQQLRRQVAGKQLTRASFTEQLSRHVEKIDQEQAMELATAAGREKGTVEIVSLAERKPENSYTKEYVGGGIRMQLLTKLRTTDR